MLTARQFADTVAEVAPARRHLRAVVHEVNKPKIRRRQRMVATVLGGLVAIGALQLTFNLAIVQGAYELDALEVRSASLSKEIETTSDALTVLESPQSLATKAAQLGMVPTSSAVFMDIATGATAGVPAPASEDAELTDGYVPNQLLENGEANVEVADPVVAPVDAAPVPQDAKSAESSAATARAPKGVIPTPKTH
ncbi:hypothetical protein [Agromyces humi]|uniref:hypothetical protein n=1 Tax=Agromyces humi TaxID=1766800 RepID=UPI00135B4AE9|nr:hypothetical protein [Agromyces humi]